MRRFGSLVAVVLATLNDGAIRQRRVVVGELLQDTFGPPSEPCKPSRGSIVKEIDVAIAR